MSALTEDRLIPESEDTFLVLGAVTAKEFFAGALICKNAGGYATPGDTALNLVAVGRCEEYADNRLGQNGDVQVKIKRGKFRYDNSADADEITAADIDNICYIVDDATVAKTSAGGTRSVAGRIRAVEAGGVWVTVGYGPYTSADGGVMAANNGSDFTSAATTFGNLKQAASATATGVVELATQAEVLTGTDAVRPVTPATLAGAAYQKFGTPVFVIGAEAGNAINVAIQMKDAAEADLAVRGSVLAYLATESHGDVIAATAPSGGVAIGTDGLAIPLVAGKAFQLVSEADGDIDLTITEAGAATWYLVLVMPDGRLVVSDAIIFAA